MCEPDLTNMKSGENHRFLRNESFGVFVYTYINIHPNTTKSLR